MQPAILQAGIAIPGSGIPTTISIQQPGIERPAIPGLKNRPRIT